MKLYAENFVLEYWKEIENEKYGDMECYLYWKGHKYFEFAMTLKKIQDIMMAHSKTGECLNGSYFILKDLLILNEITEQTLLESMQDLLSNENTDSIATLFTKLD